MFKDEKGITLVALVVTIIILLILAGVALTIALQDNGLFHYSSNAAAAYKEEATKEGTTLNTAENALTQLYHNYLLDTNQVAK